MAYTKTVHTDGVTPLDAANENHKEQGIYDAHAAAATADTKAVNAQNSANSAALVIDNHDSNIENPHKVTCEQVGFHYATYVGLNGTTAQYHFDIRIMRKPTLGQNLFMGIITFGDDYPYDGTAEPVIRITEAVTNDSVGDFTCKAMTGENLSTTTAFIAEYTHLVYFNNLNHTAIFLNIRE
jgi:hypothetical protein